MQISSSVSVKDNAGVVPVDYTFLSTCHVGAHLHHHILLINPNLVNSGLLHQAVLCDSFGKQMVGEVNLIHCVVIGQCEDDLIAEMACVYSQSHIARISSVASENSHLLSSSEIEDSHTSVIVEQIESSIIEFEVFDGQLLLMQEGPVQNLQSSRLEGINNSHDIKIGIVSVMDIYVFCKVGSDEISEVILSVQDHAPAIDGGKSYIHVVFKGLWQNSLRGSVHIYEDVLKAKKTFLSAVNNSNMLFSQPDCVIAEDVLFTFHSHFFSEVRDGLVCSSRAPSDLSDPVVLTQGHQVSAPSVAHVVQVIGLEPSLLKIAGLDLGGLVSQTHEIRCRG